MDEASMQRFVGAIEARTTMLEKRMDVVERDIKAQLAAIDASIQGIRSAVDSSRGGWRAIAWFVGLMGGVATLLTVLYQIGAIR